MPISTLRWDRETRTGLLRIRLSTQLAIVEWAKSFRYWVAILNPVLTGRSSASWNLNVSEADLSHKPRDFFNPTSSRLNPPIAVISTTGFTLGRSLHVTNTVPYIHLLERGHSQQQPVGWILATFRGFAARGIRGFFKLQ